MVDKENAEAFDLLEQDILNSASPGIRPGLSRMAKCLGLLGNPQRDFKAIHIVGTNGKGSTASTIASILSSSGLKTALYTSPHLLHMGERLKIEGKIVSPQRWMETWQKVKLVLRENFIADTPPTAFELMTTVAFLILSEEKVDVAVVEAGMGGRLDATNLLGEVILSVITSISLDHTNFLGDTISQIAKEKFSVIRPGKRAIYVGGDFGLEELFIDTCAKMISEGHIFSRECLVKPAHFSLDGVIYDFWTSKGYFFDSLETKLTAAYQIGNTALAVFAALLLKDVFPGISDKTIRSGLLSVSWPGRFEIIRLKNGKVLILDGAHNPEGMVVFAQSLKQVLRPHENITFVTAMMKDKDIRETLKKLCNLPIEKIVCTQVPQLDRSESSHALADIARNIFTKAFIGDEAELNTALCEAVNSHSSYIAICGSLYLIGAIKKILRSDL